MSTEDPVVESPKAGDAARDRRPRGLLVFLVIVFGLVALVLIGALLGLRAFIMQTPSMGTAAPVGSLVVTAPAELGDVHTGDIITFRQQPHAESHTHRVVSTETTSVHTKGDINGSEDAGTVDQSKLVGKAVFICPVLGWGMKMLPIVLGVLLVSMLFMRRVNDPIKRFRYLGMSTFFGVAIAIAVVKPLFGAQLLWMRVDSSDKPHATASVVNTGLFPISVAPEEDHGTSTGTLSPTGAVGEAVTTKADSSGHFVFMPHLSLDIWWWIGMALFCLSPFILLGLHRVIVGRRKPSEKMTDDDAKATTTGGL